MNSQNYTVSYGYQEMSSTLIVEGEEECTNNNANETYMSSESQRKGRRR
jgi:hypothetical protein